jgi:hypothetical protein
MLYICINKGKWLKPILNLTKKTQSKILNERVDKHLKSDSLNATTTMANKNAQQSVLGLTSFQKEGFLHQQLLNGNKFTITNVKIGDYYHLFTNSIINPSPRYQRP